MCCVKRNKRSEVPSAPRGAASAWPDVDGVEAPKLARELVLAADQEQLVGIGVLSAEPVFAGQDPSPQRNAADGDRAPSPQWRQFLVGPSVVLPHPGVSPQQVLGELSRSERVDPTFMVLDRRGGAVRRALSLESR